MSFGWSGESSSVTLSQLAIYTTSPWTDLALWSDNCGMHQSKGNICCNSMLNNIITFDTLGQDRLELSLGKTKCYVAGCKFSLYSMINNFAYSFLPIPSWASLHKHSHMLANRYTVGSSCSSSHFALDTVDTLHKEEGIGLISGVWSKQRRAIIHFFS